MAVKVIAHYEKSWFDDPITDRRLYDHLTRCFADTSLQMISEWAEADTEGKTVVILDEQGTKDLAAFTHPANACYVFGRTGQNNLLTDIEHDVSVRIVTPNSICMFGSTAAGMVLWDRHSKGQE